METFFFSFLSLDEWVGGGGRHVPGGTLGVYPTTPQYRGTYHHYGTSGCREYITRHNRKIRAVDGEERDEEGGERKKEEEGEVVRRARGRGRGIIPVDLFDYSIIRLSQLSHCRYSRFQV